MNAIHQNRGKKPPVASLAITPAPHMPLKRGFDILFSLLVLIALFPFLLTIAAAIRLLSKGPVIFSHERIGRRGIPFHCYKFRTMYCDAEERLKKLLKESPDLNREWQERRKLKNDPRVIPYIGLFLRKTSLDEFPQFWNVLKGDLSVVGPRPVVAEEVLQHYGDKAQSILSIRPGLTCLWQVSGRSNTDYTTRIKLDELYVQKRSFRFDLILIMQTIRCLMTMRGAY